MQRIVFFWWAGVLGVVLPAALADPILEGYTVISGKGYAFELKAPQGWYLDDTAARGQGVNVAFFPKGYEWDDAPAVCYARVRTVGGEVNRVEDQVKDTLRNLRQNGATDPAARFVRTITTQDASKAQVYYFSGDRFGNREATAYIQAKASIQFVTLSARDQTAFQNALPAFESLVSSYEDLTKSPSGDGGH
ncbi:MAG: hypothetical protein JOY92_03330 [Verrucomicrobia bacterium]|nr:hypothetical protein [Verrucomicrobiota bacterium]